MNAVTTARPTLAVLPTLAELAEPYGESLAGEKKSPETVRTYRKALGRLASFLGDGATPAEVTPKSIRRFMAHHHALGASTLRLALSATRSFSRWCIDQGYRADDPTIGIRWPRLPELLPRALSGDQLARLEQVLAARPRRAMDPRTKRLIPVYRRTVVLMLYAGLRRQEASTLRWPDVDLARGTILVRGKGSRERLLPLHPRLREELGRVAPADRVGYVITSSRTGGRRLHKAMGRIFEVWLRGEGLDISAHQLRHTFAAQLLDHGADLEQIRQLLGHKSLRDTQRYLSLHVARKRAAVLLLPGRMDQEA